MVLSMVKVAVLWGEEEEDERNLEDMTWEFFQQEALPRRVKSVSYILTHNNAEKGLSEESWANFREHCPSESVKGFRVLYESEAEGMTSLQLSRALEVSFAAGLDVAGAQETLKKVGALSFDYPGGGRCGFITVEFNNGTAKEIYVGFRNALQEEDSVSLLDSGVQDLRIASNFLERSQVIDTALLFQWATTHNVILCGYNAGGAVAATRLLTSLPKMDPKSILESKIRAISFGSPLFASEECRKEVFQLGAAQLFSFVVVPGDAQSSYEAVPTQEPITWRNRLFSWAYRPAPQRMVPFEPLQRSYTFLGMMHLCESKALPEKGIDKLLNMPGQPKSIKDYQEAIRCEESADSAPPKSLEMSDESPGDCLAMVDSDKKMWIEVPKCPLHCNAIGLSLSKGENLKVAMLDAQVPESARFEAISDHVLRPKHSNKLCVTLSEKAYQVIISAKDCRKLKIALTFYWGDTHSQAWPLKVSEDKTTNSAVVDNVVEVLRATAMLAVTETIQARTPGPEQVLVINDCKEIAKILKLETNLDDCIKGSHPLADSFTMIDELCRRLRAHIDGELTVGLKMTKAMMSGLGALGAIALFGCGLVVAPVGLMGIGVVLVLGSGGGAAIPIFVRKSQRKSDSSYSKKLHFLIECSKSCSMKIPITESISALEKCIQTWQTEIDERNKSDPPKLYLQGYELEDESRDIVLDLVSIVSRIARIRVALLDNPVVTLIGPKNAGKSLGAKVIFGLDTRSGHDQEAATLAPTVYTCTDPNFRVIDTPGTTEPKDLDRIAERFIVLGALGGWCIVFLPVMNYAVDRAGRDLINIIRESYNPSRILILVTRVDEKQQDEFVISSWSEKLKQIQQNLSDDVLPLIQGISLVTDDVVEGVWGLDSVKEKVIKLLRDPHP